MVRRAASVNAVTQKAVSLRRSSFAARSIKRFVCRSRRKPTPFGGRAAGRGSGTWVTPALATRVLYYDLAVLGGELAVPCTRNPLKRD